MSGMKQRKFDLPIIMGIVALLVFGHIMSLRASAGPGPTGPLHKQGAGSAYGPQPDERSGQLEYQARNALMEMGSSQMSYSRKVTSGHFGYFHDLLGAGYLLPNATPTSIVNGYSIAFYLPATRSGFTIIAEPSNLELRPLMITENENVIVLTPTIEQDPDQGWKDLRDFLEENRSSYGRYQFPFYFQTAAHDPPLQARLNHGQSNYVLLTLTGVPESGYHADDSLIFSSYFNTYLVGDLRYIQ
jgi:hypothetical protein